MAAILRSWTARFVIFGVLFGLVLFPERAIVPLVLWSVGLAAAMAIAIGTLRMSLLTRRNIRLVGRSGEISSPRDQAVVAVCGTIEALAGTLRSPIRGDECLAYLYCAWHLVSSTAGGHRSRNTIFDYGGFGSVPAAVRGPRLIARLGGFPQLHEFGDGELTSGRATANAVEYLRFARFDPVPKGEMIAWVSLMDKKWDGRGRELRRDFRREAGFDPAGCIFREQRVIPGEEVCVLGVWSEREGAVIGTAEQELWLYQGSPETVRALLKSSRGCEIVVAIILGLGSVATAIWLR